MSINKTTYRSLNKMSLYFFMFIIIYMSDDTYLFRADPEYHIFINIKYFFYFALLIWIFFKYQKQLFRSGIKLLIALTCLILLTSFLRFDFTGGYIFQVLTLFLSYFFVKIIDFKSFAQTYCKFIYFFAWTSIILLILTIVVPSIVSNFPIIINTSGKETNHLILYTSLVGHTRNAGIFREPGVYQLYLNFALFLQIFVLKKINKKELIVLILCLLTTASTAGIIIAIIIFFVAILFKNDSLAKNSRRNLTLFAYIFVLVIIFNPAVYNEIFDKLSKDSGFYISTLARISSLTIPLYMFFQSVGSFIIGLGLNDFTLLYVETSLNLYNFPFTADGTGTNTYLNKFATYGFLYGFIFIYGVFNFCKKIFTKSLFKKYIFFIVFLMMFSNEDVRNSFLFNMIFFYGMIGQLSKLKLKTL